jgi:hypothetical protein
MLAIPVYAVIEPEYWLHFIFLKTILSIESGIILVKLQYKKYRNNTKPKIHSAVPRGLPLTRILNQKN